MNSPSHRIHVRAHGHSAEVKGDSYSIRQAAGDYAAALAERTSEKVSNSVFRNRRDTLIKRFAGQARSHRILHWS